jgi:hypothetical protein
VVRGHFNLPCATRFDGSCNRRRRVKIVDVTYVVATRLKEFLIAGNSQPRDHWFFCCYQSTVPHLYSGHIAQFPIWNLKQQGEPQVLNMGKRYYVAAHTDSDCVCCCNHKHPNVSTATACISEAGGYVVAVRRRRMLQLTGAEEAEFQKAMYGRTESFKQTPDLALLLSGKLKTQS